MTLDIKELDAAVEGILFAAGEPIHIDRICLALDLDKLSVQQILQRLGTITPLSAGVFGWSAWRTATSSAPPRSTPI